MEYSRVEKYRQVRRAKRVRKGFKWILIVLSCTAVICAGLWVYSTEFLTFLGRSLMVEQPIQQADMIVVFAGSNDRIEHAIELYKKGYAPKIFLSGGRKGNYSSAGRMKNTALKKGVPPEAIILDEDAYSTYDNAVHTVELARRKEYKSGIIVTSPYHMLRSMWTINHVTEKSGLSLRWIPSQSTSSPFRPDSWWKDPDMKKSVIDEYGKLVGYWLVH